MLDGGRPAVDVLFTNYNHGKYLDNLIASFRRSTYPINRIIMVDNASTDGSADMVQAKYPEIHVIRNSENLGFAGASNQGLRASTSRYVCLTGPDVEVADNWLEELVGQMQARSDCIFCCSRGMDLRDREIILTAGCSINYLGYMVLRNRFRTLTPDLDMRPVEISIVDSTSVLMDREKFLQLGFLDEDLFLYFDEMDFCLRAAILKGWKSLYVPTSVVYHGYGSEVSSFRGEKVKFPAFRAYLMTKNRFLVMLKCYHWKTLLITLPVLAAFELVTIAFHARHGVMRSYLKGVAWNLRHLPATLAKRRQLQRGRVTPDHALLSAEPLTINPRLHASRLEGLAYRALNRLVSGYWRLTLGRTG